MDLDLKQFVRQVLDVAKGNLSQDGFLIPVAFLITPEGIFAVPVQFENPEQKERAYREVVEEAKRRKSLAIVTLNDARYSTDASKEFLECYYQGKLAEERSPECIVMTVSGPGVANWNLTLPYQRTEKGIVFGQIQENDEVQINLLGSWASDLTNPS